MAGRFDALDALFKAVREASKPAIWSRGVELTRAGAVVVLPSASPDSESPGDSPEEEHRFRVTAGTGPVAPTVTLFLDDADWECQCKSKEDVCEHVAASVIAWRRDLEEGSGILRDAEDAGQVVYHFTRTTGGLGLHRTLDRGDRSYPLEGTLVSLASGRPGAPQFIASQADMGAELVLGTHRRGLLARHLVPRLFRLLANSSAVRLDGHPIAIDAKPVKPVVRVTDQGEGFRVAVRDDPSISETFANGIARCGEALRPLAETQLSGRELHELPRGRTYGPSDVGTLVTEVLPSLGKRLPLDIQTTRLPDTVMEPPRVRIETERDGNALSVLATLVYGSPPSARVDGGRLIHLQGTIPLRDEAGEKLWMQKLRGELGLVPGAREVFVAEEAVDFADRLGKWKDKWEHTVEGNAPHYFRRAPALSPKLSLEGDRFEVDFESIAPGVTDAAGGGPRRGIPGGVGGQGGHAEPAAVLQAWREGASMVPLLEGGWAPLPADWLARFGHRIADLLEARDGTGRLPACVAPDVAALCDDLEQPVPPAFDALRRLLDTSGTTPGPHTPPAIPRATLPGDLTATLRPYQRTGIDWLTFLRSVGLGGLLADDMGLGKTLQALCAIDGRSLVVAPTSVLHNWSDEIRRFRPGLRCSVYHGPGRKLDPDADVTLTTYAILRLDADALAAVLWKSLVLDEAQAIKNPDSQVARAAFRLAAEFKVTLTGTPVENRLEELWSQFHFSNRGLLGGRSSFQERYARPIAAGAPGAAKRLRERIRPFVLRRMKSEVATDLPPRTDLVLHCELSEAERDVYDTIRAATLSGVVSKLAAGGSVLAALEALLRLRQAACHPSLVPGHEAEGSSKVALLLETLDSVIAEGHKALVFSQWTSMLDLIEPHLEAAAVPFTRLDGSTADRGSVVHRFQDPDGPPVLLVSLKAGGTGLNLTAADHVFLMDLWWNPAVEDQAADRAHRIGQERPVMVYRLVAANTVEERILNLQEQKRSIADAALGDADRASGLSRDELLELLS